VPNERMPTDGSSRVKVGVRPEKISLAADEGEPPPGHNAVTGTLRMSSYIGVSHQYKVEGPGATTLTVYIQNLGAERAPQPGDRVRLSWRRENTFAVTPQDDLEPEEEDL
jgi:spermidine/putrescine transport system ATP-binding protein